MVSADTINKIIELIESNNEYKQIFKKFIPNNKDRRNEFKQYIYLTLLESKNKQELVDLWNVDKNKFRFYFCRVVTNNIISSTSPWYLKFRDKDNTIELDTNTIDLEDDSNDVEIKMWNEYKLDLINTIINLYININSTNFRNFTLFKMYYYEKMNYKEISNKTNIPVTNVFNYITKAKNIIKEKLKIND